MGLVAGFRIPAPGLICGLVVLSCAVVRADIGGPPIPVYLNPARVDEIATDGSLRLDYPSWISPDGLQLLFNSNRNGGHTEMFLISRPNTSSPFAAPTQAPFVNVNGGSGDTRSGIISSSGLELFYYGNAGASPHYIYRATRTDTSQAFSDPQALTSVLTNPTGVHDPQRISADGLRLYFIDTSSTVVHTTGQYVATRPDLNSPFGTPSNAPFVNLGYAESIYLTPDELQMLYINDSVLKWTWRPDLATPFAPGTALSSLTSGWSFVMAGLDAYYANNDDVWHATLLPEPGSVMAMGACALFLAHRRPRHCPRRSR